MNICNFCHKPIISDIQERVVVEEEFFLHRHCVKPMQKQAAKIGEREMRKKLSAA